MNELISKQDVLNLAKDLKFDNVESFKYYRYRCIDPNDVRELPPAKIEYDVRFEDEDHVWIDGKRQYISLRRFQEAVTSAKTGRETGIWIPVHPLQSDDPGAYMCSKCETGMWEIRPSEYHYCPHCGADMRGEEDG